MRTLHYSGQFNSVLIRERFHYNCIGLEAVLSLGGITCDRVVVCVWGVTIILLLL